MSPFVARWAEVDGRSMHARVGATSATAAPVVLVHGLGVSSSYFEPASALLARDFAVYVPDLPGTGLSERPPSALDVPELSAALVAWLDAMGLARASFVANSMGCQVVATLAASAPRRVDRLVLLGPTVDPRWRSISRQLPRWLLEAAREPISLLPILVRDYLRFGPLRFTRTARFALADRIETKLPLVEAPTLVVRGERDAFVSSAWVERLAALAPNGRSAVVPGAAHAAHYAAPEAFASLVREFLRGEAPAHRMLREVEPRRRLAG